MISKLVAKFFVLALLVLSPITLFGVSKKSDFFEFFFFRKIKFDTFAVSASSVDNLKRNLLNKDGPRDPHGVHRYAVTKWDIKWNWPVRDGLSADYARSKVATNIIIQVPKWRVEGASLGELRKWQNIYINLINHELEHARTALKTASMMRSQLLDLDKMTNKSPDVGNKIASKLIAKNRTWDLEYDKLTEHGKNQGVH